MLAEQDVTPSMRHDAKKHKLSTDDVRELRQIFEMFDTDQSGTIDAAELADVMRTVGLNPTPDELAAYVRQADVDGDGCAHRPAQRHGALRGLTLCLALRVCGHRAQANIVSRVCRLDGGVQAAQ